MRLTIIATFGLFVASTLPAAAQESASEATLCEQVFPGSANREQARTTARNMITAKAGTPSAAFLNGCLVYGDGKPDKAASFFEIAAKEPKSLYFDWLGRAYGEQTQAASKIKQPFLARKTKNAFEKAVALDGDNINARAYLAQFYQLAPGVMGGSEEKAREQVQAIRSRNAYRGALAAAGYASRANDPAGAEKEYLALTKSHPDSLAPWNGLLGIQVQARRWTDAFATADALRALAGREANGDYAIGRIAALSGEQLDKGEAALRRYLTITPSSTQPSLASAHFRLGQIMAAKKDTTAARAQYQAALKLQPDHAEAKKALASLK